MVKEKIYVKFEKDLRDTDSNHINEIMKNTLDSPLEFQLKPQSQIIDETAKIPHSKRVLKFTIDSKTKKEHEQNLKKLFSQIDKMNIGYTVTKIQI